MTGPAASDRDTVVVTFKTTDDMRTAIEELLGPMADVVYLQDADRQDRLRILEGARALLAWSPWRELEPDEIPRLRAVPLLQLISAGADQVRFEDIPASMTVASNVGAYAEPMAEHVLAMILALAKRLFRTQAELARGHFNQWTRTLPIQGSVCGILGFGGIGKATAHRMRVLGASIHAVNTSGRTDEPVDFIGTLDELETVLAASRLPGGGPAVDEGNARTDRRPPVGPDEAHSHPGQRSSRRHR